jgi:hypothetical protein
MRAKKGANVSQLYYAKQGLITPDGNILPFGKPTYWIITRTKSHAMPTPK